MLRIYNLRRESCLPTIFENLRLENGVAYTKKCNRSYLCSLLDFLVTTDCHKLQPLHVERSKFCILSYLESPFGVVLGQQVPDLFVEKNVFEQR